MSGSSLDGLDLVLNNIEIENDNYSYTILKAETFTFTKTILDKLKNCRNLSSFELCAFDIEFGIYIGNIVNLFINKHEIKSNIDFIACHGHTVYHYPSDGFTLQIGNGFHISHITSIPTINNLRMADISHGGQGTPIVPIGDLLLFKDYIYCLNLGGIMNISYKTNSSIISYDLGVCNQVLNYYASKKGFNYDKNGAIASKGNLNTHLFNDLNAHEFFKLKYPKSLDNSFSSSCLLPIIEKYNITIEDKLNTFCHHIVFQIKNNLITENTILITGGGAKNSYLISLFTYYNINYFLPNEEIIDYKEALIMSLMGVRFMEKKYNVLKSVTGASKNTINGQLHINQ